MGKYGSHETEAASAFPVWRSFFAANFRDGECHATIFGGAFASFYVYVFFLAPIEGDQNVFFM